MTPHTEPSVVESHSGSPLAQHAALLVKLRELSAKGDSQKVWAERRAIGEEADAIYHPFEEKVLPLAIERLQAEGYVTDGRLIGMDIGERVTVRAFEAAEGYVDRVTPSMLNRVIDELNAEHPLRRRS